MRDRTKKIFAELKRVEAMRYLNDESEEEPFKDSGSEYVPSDIDEQIDQNNKAKLPIKKLQSDYDYKKNIYEAGPSGYVSMKGNSGKSCAVLDESESDDELLQVSVSNEPDSDNEPLIRKKAKLQLNNGKANRKAQELPRNGENEFPEDNTIIGQEIEQKPSIDVMKKSRKRKSHPGTWKRNERRDKKNRGTEYQTSIGIMIPEKLPCVGKRLCREKCRLKCDEKFVDETRRRLFAEYYSLEANQKNSYLFGVMEPFAVKQHLGVNKHRQKSFKYFFTVDGERRQVCKEAVLSMLQIGRKKIDLIRNQISAGRSAPKPDERGRHNNRPNATPDEKREIVHEHIKSFPHEMSHYSRHKNPNRLYLSPWLSINKMYDLYRIKCANEDLIPISSTTYRHIFVNDFNFGFGSPKTDTCKVCDTETNDEHIAKFKKAFEQQKVDRNMARQNGKIIYITFDLQKTLSLPKISTGKAFYLRQVWLYNLEIHSITINQPNGKGYFHVWTEDQGSRGPEEVGTAILAFLENIKDEGGDFDHLVAWSDSAGGQNKNFFIVCLWHYLISAGVFKKIDHKFPEVGHTFMDSDRDFAAVEKSIRKHQNIHTVDQYLTIMTELRKKTPFNITRMSDKFV